MSIINTVLQNTSLDNYLYSIYFSKKDIHLLKMEKRILVNNSIVVSDCNLQSGDIVEIDYHCEEYNTTKTVISTLDILYEDDVCLIINKPINLIIHDDQDNSVTLDKCVAYYYEQTEQKHGVYHVHRLDKDTSGIILYCKEKYLLACFDRMLEKKEIRRFYLAKVSGMIKRQTTIDRKIGKDRHVSNKYRISDTGKEATTHVRPIKIQGKSTIVECELETGRTHQIRVHLSSIGHPIEGDTLYGGKKCDRMKLHSYRIIFIHPITKEKIDIQSKIDF